MKSLIVRVLAAIGLVPAARYARVSRQLDEVGSELHTWKKQARRARETIGALERRVSELEKQLRQQARQLKGARNAPAQREMHETTETLRASETLKTTEMLKTSETREFAAMQARLVEAERAATLAREQLMAIEVKLEILEGAANVLDARTRAAIQQSRKTEAAV